VQCRRKRGAEAQAIGPSRGGRTIKIHAVVDAIGRLLAFELSPGQRGDIRAAETLLEPLPVAAALFADTAYDSAQFRGFLTCRGTTPVIRPNPTRKKPPPFDEALYRRRNVIERSFSHLKDWR
jgi:transposase